MTTFDAPAKSAARVPRGSVPPPCGRCRRCRAGLGDHCETSLASLVGDAALASPHGAFAPRLRVAADRVTRTPEGLDEVSATFAEPAAVAAHALARAGNVLGDCVVVVGGGTIGLLTVELARLAGAAEILVVEPDGCVNVPLRLTTVCESSVSASTCAPGVGGMNVPPNDAK